MRSLKRLNKKKLNNSKFNNNSKKMVNKLLHQHQQHKIQKKNDKEIVICGNINIY